MAAVNEAPTVADDGLSVSSSLSSPVPLEERFLPLVSLVAENQQRIPLFVRIMATNDTMKPGKYLADRTCVWCIRNRHAVSLVCRRASLLSLSDNKRFDPFAKCCRRCCSYSSIEEDD
jgi:hypothetical protein